MTAGVAGSGATSGFGGVDAAGVWASGADGALGADAVSDDDDAATDVSAVDGVVTGAASDVVCARSSLTVSCDASPPADGAALDSPAAASVRAGWLRSVDARVAAAEAVPAADGAAADGVCVRSSLTAPCDASSSADGAALDSPAAVSVPVCRLGSVDAGGAVPRLSAAPVPVRRDGSAACESPSGRVPDVCAEPSSGRVPVGGTDPSARPSPRTCAPLLARTTGRDSGSRSTMPPVRSRRAEPSPVIAASSQCRAGTHSPHCPRHSRPRSPNHSRSPNQSPRPVRPGADGGRRRRSRRPHRR